MAATAAKDSWVARVLGIGMPSPSGLGKGGGLALVRLGKARLAWETARRAAVADIGRLRAAVNGEYAGDAARAAALKGALGRIDALIARLDSRLETDLDTLLNAAPGQDQTDALRAAREMLRDVQALVEDDPLMGQLDGNDILEDVVVQAPLQARLADIAASLT